MRSAANSRPSEGTALDVGGTGGTAWALLAAGGRPAKHKAAKERKSLYIPSEPSTPAGAASGSSSLDVVVRWFQWLGKSGYESSKFNAQNIAKGS